MTRYRSPFVVAALASALLFGSVACRNRAEAGYAAPIAPAELAERLGTAAAPLILDVRSSREYSAGHVPKAINIPYNELGKRLGELGPDKSEELVVYCLEGKRAAVAEHVLALAGYTNIRNLEGQLRAWRGAGYPIE